MSNLLHAAPSDPDGLDHTGMTKFQRNFNHVFGYDPGTPYPESQPLDLDTEREPTLMAGGENQSAAVAIAYTRFEENPQPDENGHGRPGEKGGKKSGWGHQGSERLEYATHRPSQEDTDVRVDRVSGGSLGQRQVDQFYRWDETNAIGTSGKGEGTRRLGAHGGPGERDLRVGSDQMIGRATLVSPKLPVFNEHGVKGPTQHRFSEARQELVDLPHRGLRTRPPSFRPSSSFNARGEDFDALAMGSPVIAYRSFRSSPTQFNSRFPSYRQPYVEDFENYVGSEMDAE
ncbi:uncharacterized protein RAG0_00561 [Rhynchosporium agropyri]|uniref:Uncharacterized protein n=1 Tax=Rhynchosporium agropyri TaxID=914238 RepID=A0A1E1JTF8_9HELO|nr:uncharacterized protein RAG0_00561 [Rhynchosporium agropyri]